MTLLNFLYWKNGKHNIHINTFVDISEAIILVFQFFNIGNLAKVIAILYGSSVEDAAHHIDNFALQFYYFDLLSPNNLFQNSK